MKRRLKIFLSGIFFGIALLLSAVCCFAGEEEDQLNFTVEVEGEFALGQYIYWTITPDSPGDYAYQCGVWAAQDTISEFDNSLIGILNSDENRLFFRPVVPGDYDVFLGVTDKLTGKGAHKWLHYSLEPAEGFPSVRTVVEQAAAECCAECSTEYEKALWLYRYVKNRRGSGLIDWEKEFVWNFYSAEGILIRGDGVCQSYAEAYAMLCHAAGLEADFVSGLMGKVPHAWNMVRIDGNWVLAEPMSDSGNCELFGLTYDSMTTFAYTFTGTMLGNDFRQCTTLEYNPHYQKKKDGLVLPACDNASEEALLRFWAETALLFRSGGFLGELMIPDWYQDEKGRSETEILQWGADMLNRCSGWTKEQSVWFNGRETDMEVFEPTYFWYRDSASCVPGRTEYIQIDIGTIPEEIEDDTGDGLHYRWTADENSLVISGSGEMQDYTGDDLLSETFRPWGNYMTNPGHFIGTVYPVYNVLVEDGVSSVGSYAFYGLTSTLFYGYYPSLRSASIGDDVEKIGSHAFEKAEMLRNINFGNAVEEIGDSAFDGCSRLNSFSLPESLSVIGDAAFRNCSDSMDNLSLPGGVRQIGAEAFSGCTALTEVALCAGIETIGENAFRDCSIGQVVYCGTEDDWNAMEIGTGNESLLQAPRIYITRTSGTCGGSLTWQLENGVLTISGEGPMDDYQPGTGEGASPWARNVTIRKVIFEGNVTGIGSSAFYGCAGLTEVVWDDAMASIGDDAFRGCSALRTVTLPDGISALGKRAFQNCRTLRTVQLPDTLEEISEAAFKNDISIRSLTLGGATAVIHEEAFYGCDAVRLVTLPETLQRIGNYAFYNCSNLRAVDIPASTESIGEYAFVGCGKLSDVIFREGLVSIEDYAFYQLYGLPESLTLPESLRHIGAYAFAQNHGVRQINIPQGIEYIGDYAFFRLGSLDILNTNIDIPGTLDRLQYVGVYAFLGTGLRSISFGSALTGLGRGFASECPYLETVTFPDTLEIDLVHMEFVGCECLQSLVTPKGMRIADLNLSGCSSLETLIIGESWDYGSFAECKFTEISDPAFASIIRDYQFFNCVNLRSWTVLDGTSEIGEYAFAGCISLTDVYIPDSVTKIGASAIPAETVIHCRHGSCADEWAASNGNPVVYTNEKLGPPARIDISDAGIASWPPVEHAGGYEVLWAVTYGVRQEYTRKLSARTAEDGTVHLDLKALVRTLGIWYDGDIEFCVRTLADESGEYSDSDYSEAAVYAFSNIPEGMELLPAPEERSVDQDGNASWRPVEGAGSYRLAVYPESADGTKYDILVEDVQPEGGLIRFPLAGQLDGLGFYYHGELRIDIQAVPEDPARYLPGNYVELGRYHYIHDPDGQTMLELPSQRIIYDNGIILWSPSDHADSYTFMIRCTDGLPPLPEYTVTVTEDQFMYYYPDYILLENYVIGLLRKATGDWYPLRNYAGNLDIYMRAESGDERYVSSPWGKVGQYFFAGQGVSGKVILDMPECSVSDDGILTWTAVEHADYYNAAYIAGDRTINAGFSSEQMRDDAGTRLYLEEVEWTGAVDVYLQAVSRNGSVYNNSEFRYAGSFDYSYVYSYQLGNPQGQVTEDGIAEWDPVWGAYNYEITVSMDEGSESVLYADNSMIEGGKIRVDLEEAVGETGPCGVDATVYIQACYPTNSDWHISSDRVVLGYLRTHHNNIETVDAVAATCTAEGRTAYRICHDCGKYFDDAFSEIQKDSWIIPASGHAWNAAEYVWADDGLSVTASRTCKNDAGHTESETVEAVISLTPAPTETDEGRIVYRAVFENAAFEEQTRIIDTIPPLGEMDVLYLPENLRVIEAEAFAGTECEAVIVPESCTEIRQGAFAGCDRLLYVRIPAGTAVADDAFDGCGDVYIDRADA